MKSNWSAQFSKRRHIESIMLKLVVGTVDTHYTHSRPIHLYSPACRYRTALSRYIRRYRTITFLPGKLARLSSEWATLFSVLVEAEHTQWIDGRQKMKAKREREKEISNKKHYKITIHPAATVSVMMWKKSVCVESFAFFLWTPKPKDRYLCSYRG